tara:strand:- start:763 stop:1005 length:243 start_codon:yes stop_codon:yes gene_type:complete
MKGYDPINGLSNTAMEIFSPRKSVIIDMIMVQLLTIIVTLAVLLLTSSDKMDSNSMAYLVVGLFSAFFMLTGVYSRISEV